MMRPRMTTRRLIVAIAVLSVLLAYMAELSNYYGGAIMRSRAYQHKNRAYNIWTMHIASWQSELPGGPVPSQKGEPPANIHNVEWDAFVEYLPLADRTDIKGIVQRYEFHQAMRRKWERAGTWSDVEADLPPPPVSPSLQGRWPF